MPSWHETLDGRGGVSHEGLDGDVLGQDVHLLGLDLREVEDVVDQPEKVLGVRADLSEIGLERVLPEILRLLLKHLG